MDGKVIVACRDEICRDMLLRILTGEGLNVFATSNEGDLLLELLERDYQVIIFDIENSLLDGLTIVKILRKIRPKVALIVLSHDPSRELGGKILHEGVSYYAVKPLDPETIKKAAVHALVKQA